MPASVAGVIKVDTLLSCRPESMEDLHLQSKALNPRLIGFRNLTAMTVPLRVGLQKDLEGLSPHQLISPDDLQERCLLRIPRKNPLQQGREAGYRTARISNDHISVLGIHDSPFASNFVRRTTMQFGDRYHTKEFTHRRAICQT